MKWTTLIIILFIADLFTAPAMARVRPGLIGQCEDMGDADACDALIKSGKYKNKKEDLTRAYYWRGIGYCKDGNYDKAIHDLNEVIRLGGDLGEESYEIRGAAYYQNHQYDKAIADYDRAIAYYDKVIRLSSNFPPHFLNRDLAQIYHDRGVAKQGKGDQDGAATDFAKALELGYRQKESLCGESY